jgi:hypothetical protein
MSDMYWIMVKGPNQSLFLGRWGLSLEFMWAPSVPVGSALIWIVTNLVAKRNRAKANNLLHPLGGKRSASNSAKRELTSQGRKVEYRAESYP